jgi:hypothetical protein
MIKLDATDIMVVHDTPAASNTPAVPSDETIRRNPTRSSRLHGQREPTER